MSDIVPQSLRTKMLQLEKMLLDIPGTVYGDQAFCPLTHSFGKGLYVREIFCPKGTLIVTKIHKYTHPYFMLKGDVSMVTVDGIQRLKAPVYGMTLGGTKRVFYIHEDTTWITVHATQETDLEKIETEIIAKDFEEIDALQADTILASLEG